VDVFDGSDGFDGLVVLKIVLPIHPVVVVNTYFALLKGTYISSCRR